MALQKSIQTKLIVTFTAVLITAIFLTTLINTLFARHNLEVKLTSTEIPSTIENINGEIEREILSAVSGLSVFAEDPYFKKWVINGENQEELPILKERLEKITKRFNTKGSSFVSWKTKGYYEITDAKYSYRVVGSDEGWFPAFKESGEQTGINVYTKHDLYGTVAFINCRVDNNGEFLGLVSVALDLSDFVRRVTERTIGDQGSTYMIDREGMIQIHSDSTKIASQSITETDGFKEHSDKILSENDYVFEYRGKSGVAYVNSTYIPEMGWYLITEANQKELFSQITAANQLSALLAALFIAIGVAIVFVIVRNITSALRTGVSIAEAVAQGDLTTTVNFSGDDEIGHLGNAMRKMIQSLQEKGEVLQKIAEGNLTVPVTPSSDRDILAQNIEQMRLSLVEILSGVSTTSRELKMGTHQISESSQALASGATEQASTLEEVSAALNEVNHNSSTTASKANEANNIATTMRDQANQGHENMTEMLGAMEKINETSAKIGQVIKVIDDIAFQTNLLALNAAVEAARAGVHGKGFAVVADEVRNLAGRSAKAVEETGDMVNSTINAISLGNGVAEKTSEQLNKIVESVSEVVTNLDEISEMGTHQSNDISQINSSINQIEQVTQMNAASAEEGASSSVVLADQAKNLDTLIAKFQFTDEHSTNSNNLFLLGHK